MHLSATLAALLFSATICHAQAVLKALPRINSHDIAVGKATARTLSPTSHVQGKLFNRFIQVWLDSYSTGYPIDDESWNWLASQGAMLANYSTIAHPSQPNYVASVGGDPHGVTTDLSYTIPKEYRTVVDLLEGKNITWSLYAESLPFSGYRGNYLDQQTHKPGYMRRQNPLMSYQSITSNPDRLAMIKNFTLFHHDRKTNKLPQWVFITPNTTNSNDDSSLKAGAKWAERFLKPLLSDDQFMADTLILVTYGENENYAHPNKVPSFLFNGDLKPRPGTIDHREYNHYSSMATVEHNWQLGSLGLKDKSAPRFVLQ